MASKRLSVKTPPPSDDSSDASSDEEDEASPKEDFVVRPANPPRAPNPNPNPSSDEEGDDGSEGDDGEESGEEESESEEEAGLDQTQKPPPPAPRPAAESSDSGSTDDPDAESDSDESSGEEPASAPRPPRAVADPSIKPIASRPMSDASTPMPKKPPASSSPAAPLPSREPEPAKKKLKAPEASPENGGQKRPLFQRIWGLEDELAILRGLAEYRAKSGSVPSSIHDMDPFHKMIRGSLGVEVNNGQLADKIRRLKKKFETNCKRRKNGEDPSFSNPHELMAYELSKKVWGAKQNVVSEDAGAESDKGDDDSDNEMPSPQGKKEKKSAPAELQLKHHGALSPSGAAANASGISSRYPYLREAVNVMAKGDRCGLAMKRALEMVDDSKARAMEERLKKIKLTQFRQHLRRMDLVRETEKLILEAIAKAH